MNGHPQCTRRRAARAAGRVLRAAVAAVLLAGGAAGCTDEGAGDRAERDRRAVQRVLDRQAEAVDEGDEDAFLRTVAPEARGYRAEQQQVFGNLGRLPLQQWSYRVTGRPDRAPDSGAPGAVRVEATAQLSYRLRGFDRRPVVTTERLSLVRENGTWYVDDELRDSDRQLWEQGEITVVRGERSLVMGIGQDRARLRAHARRADGAVTAVSRAWPRDWPRRVVLEVPGSVRGMAQLLDASPSDYADIAAVTTGEAGVSRNAPADRIIVNPDAYRQLSDDGRQIVLTHETTHVATRTDTSEATPLWLSEGLADWIGYRGTGRTPRQAAPELARAVREGRVPGRLPSDEDFRFDSGRGSLARAYEGAWLASRMIAEEWGENRLTAFYRAVGDAGAGDAGGDGGGAAVDEALREVLGTSRAEFTDRWKAYLRAELT